MPRKTDFKIALGNKIKKLRTENNLTQEELGKKLNVGKTTIANYESGYSEPESEKIKQLSIIFNVSVDYLLGKTMYKNDNELYKEHNDMLNDLSNTPIEITDKINNIILDLLKLNLNENDFFQKLKQKLSDIPNEYQKLAESFAKYVYSEILYDNYFKKRSDIYNLTYSTDLTEFYMQPIDKKVNCIPLLYKIDAQKSIFDENYIFDYIPFNEPNSENYFAYQTQDDSMLPLLGVGDIAIIEKTNKYESGNTCLISLDNKEILIRKIVEYKDYIELQTAFPYAPYIKIANDELEKRNFKILGKVIRVENSSAFK